MGTRQERGLRDGILLYILREERVLPYVPTYIYVVIYGVPYGVLMATGTILAPLFPVVIVSRTNTFLPRPVLHVGWHGWLIYAVGTLFVSMNGVLPLYNEVYLCSVLCIRHRIREWQSTRYGNNELKPSA